eukprot:6055519-Heterocapsa_arctica.AAC.1
MSKLACPDVVGLACSTPHLQAHLLRHTLLARLLGVQSSSAATSCKDSAACRHARRTSGLRPRSASHQRWP